MQPKTAIISITRKGNDLSKKIAPLFYKADQFTLSKWQTNGFKHIEGGLSECNNMLFANYSQLIYIMATGIVVRSIAPYLKNKSSDPAVVVIDELGLNAISLLSGHLGGGNALTQKIAQFINANPVITTASDLNNLPSVDMIAKEYNLVIDSMKDAKEVTAMLVNQEPVALDDQFEIIQDCNSFKTSESSKGKIVITNKAKIVSNQPTAKLIIRNIILGIGCRKGKAPEDLKTFVQLVCDEFNIDIRAVKTVASIGLKKEEVAIIHLAKDLNAGFDCFDKEKLQQVDHLFKQSSFVKEHVGVGAVSSSAAFLAGKKQGVFIVEKRILNGMTLSVFQTSLK